MDFKGKLGFHEQADVSANITDIAINASIGATMNNTDHLLSINVDELAIEVHDFDIKV